MVFQKDEERAQLPDSNIKQIILQFSLEYQSSTPHLVDTQTQFFLE